MPRRTAKPPYEIMTAPTRPESTGSRSPRWSRSRRTCKGAKSLKLPEFGVAWERVRDATASGWERLVEAYASLKPAAQRAAEGDGPWWIGSKRPVTLRMPRGGVVAAVAGVVGLVLLAYWLGLGQGARDTTGKLAQNAPQNGQPGWMAAGSGLGDTTGADIPGGAETTVVPLPRNKAATARPAEPRVPGHNYLVYTLTDFGEAQRLKAFLAERGVDTLIVQTSRRVPKPAGVASDTVSGQNAWLHLVVDVTRGFSREQCLRGEHRRFLTERIQLGRAWYRHNGNRGSALESMMFYKYTPPGGTGE